MRLTEVEQAWGAKGPSGESRPVLNVLNAGGIGAQPAAPKARTSCLFGLGHRVSVGSNLGLSLGSRLEGLD